LLISSVPPIRLCELELEYCYRQYYARVRRDTGEGHEEFGVGKSVSATLEIGLVGKFFYVFLENRATWCMFHCLQNIHSPNERRGDIHPYPLSGYATD